jgi:anti-sigma regulatory factor (Ser/Thr protein kinase)
MSVAAGLGTELFDHPALLYSSAEEYVDGVAPFVRAGLDAGDPVLVAVPGPNLDLLRDHLGADAGRVLWRDMQVDGKNPGRIIPGVLLAFAEANAGRRVRIVGEPIWAGRTTIEYPACAQHEALINAVFTGRDAAILCPYDVAGLDRAAVADAYRTHPVMADVGGRWTSPGYDDPIRVAAGFNLPLPDPPDTAATMTVSLATLRAVRRFVGDHASRAGLPADLVADLVLAVNELTTNTVEHTVGGTGTLSIWTADRALVCQVHDAGHIANPLAGRLPATLPGRESGHGLLMVNQLCDLVRVHTQPGTTTVRVHTTLR